MSDFPKGAEWWKASDDRWYAPPETPDKAPPGAPGTDSEYGPDWWKATDNHWYPPPERPDRSPPPDTRRSTEKEGDSSGGRGCVWAIAVVIVLVVVFAVLGSGGDDGGDDGGGDSDDRAFGAFDVCTQFVEDRLKAPGTASFRNYFEDDGEVTVTGFGEGPYTVRSSVDAQNGFGAEIRTEFVCEVTHTGGGNWRLVSLTLDE